MSTYLQLVTRPDLSMTTHQSARFCINPMLSYERSMYRIGKYLKGTKDKGIIFKPDINKGLECYVDTDFADGWDKANAYNSTAVMSRTGYIIIFCGCPLIWCSKIQSEIAPSTTEAEYIALSQATREFLPMMELLKEINEVFSLNLSSPKIHCKVYEDNESCISLAKTQRFSPRTKHISIKYHHFRSHENN